jgi:hypothetical protein
MVRSKLSNSARHFISRIASIASVALIVFSSTWAMAKKPPPPLALCVNHSGSGGCSTTIQGAVDLVTAGATAVITIAGDTAPYDENVSVSNASISFVGAGPGMTIVDGTNASSLSTFTFQDNSNGELRQMTIQNGSGIEGSNVSFIQFKGKTSSEVGSLTIENCDITGGTFHTGNLPEGTVRFDGKTLIIDSTSIVNNDDEGIEIGSIGGKPDAFITNTTISNNQTTGDHGFASGCGIRVNSGTTVLNNDTIADNHCIGGSGMGQSPTEGGGLFVDFPGKVEISNAIIADNTVAGSTPGGPDCFAPGKGVKSKGHNLIKDTSDCNIKLAKTDIPTGTDPELAALSMCSTSGLLVPVPLGGSPVINMGNPAHPKGKLGASSTDCLPRDECGGTRVTGHCAIGAIQ